jgi:hypothetical protein
MTMLDMLWNVARIFEPEISSTGSGLALICLIDANPDDLVRWHRLADGKSAGDLIAGYHVPV